MATAFGLIQALAGEHVRVHVQGQAGPHSSAGFHPLAFGASLRGRSDRGTPSPPALVHAPPLAPGFGCFTVTLKIFVLLRVTGGRRRACGDLLFKCVR